MFCRHCGKQIKDEALFCTYCGQAVKKAAPVTNSTVEAPKSVQVEVPKSAQVEVPTSVQVETPKNVQVEVPKKKSKVVGILVCLIAVLVLVIIAGATYFILDNRDNSEGQRTTWERDEDESDRDDDRDDEADEVETEIVSEETEESDEAVATAEDLDPSQIEGLIETLCSSGNPIQSILEDPAGFCSLFMMNSIGDEADVQRIMEMYSEAYKEDYYLCMTEADVQDYLKNSIGLEDMSTLFEIASYENGYSYYDDGVFGMVRPDTGDYWIGEPIITEIRTVSDTEIMVIGEIESGAIDNTATSFFELKMTANPDSVWGGYTLSAVTRWDTYILPYVDSVYLTEADIMNWDAEYLRLARNEIYARHGRQFDDEGLQNYFGSCNWYAGTVAASEFDEAVLNEYELANRDLIVQYEQQIKDDN